ncbi:hypothetical protein ACFX2F_022862 [Malus domestica]
MGFCLPHIFAFLTLTLEACHAALPPQLYWNSVLPNSKMPKAISELLQPADFTEDKSTSIVVGKGGVNVDAGKGKLESTYVDVGKGIGVHVEVEKGKPGGGTTVNVEGKGGARVNTGKRTNVGVGKGGVSVNIGHKGKPVYVGKDIRPGTTMNLHFTTNSNNANFYAVRNCGIYPIVVQQAARNLQPIFNEIRFRGSGYNQGYNSRV